MKKTYNMPDGNVFKSIAEIETYYEVKLTGVSDNDDCVHAVVKASEQIVAHANYDEHTIKALEAQLEAIDKLPEMATEVTKDNETILQFDIENAEVIKAFENAGITPIKHLYTNDIDFVRKSVSDNMLLIKIGLGVFITNEEQDVWDSYIKHMRG